MTVDVARLADPDLAFWRTRSVARTVGLNLSEAMRGGALSTAEYAVMVERCRKCQHARACTDWLAVNGAGADHVPEHCANAATLNALTPARRTCG